MAREREQVRREHGGADVGVEARGALPDAAREAEDALEERDGALNPGAKGAELPIDPTALDHVEHGEAPLLGEADVAHFQRLGRGEIVGGGKPTVEARLARRGGAT